MSKGVLSLAVYAVLYTIALGETSYFLPLKCEIKSTVTGNENMIRNETRQNIFFLDLSKDGNKKCPKWSSLGFETFEITALVTLVLTLVHKMGRRTCAKEGWIAKIKEVKKKSEAKKFEKLRQKFEECKESLLRHEMKEPTQDKKVEKTG